MNAVTSRLNPTEIESDDWAAFLENHRLIEGIGGVPDPYKVIRVRDELWRTPAQQVLPGLDARSPATGLTAESIVTPVSFLRTLRERFASTFRMPVHGSGMTLPAALSEMVYELNASRSILDLEDGWDGEGAVGYSYSTWVRAVQFLAINAERLWEDVGYLTPAPDIGPGPDGSIDLHWALPERELLINFPRDHSQDAGFYGDDGMRGEPIEGKLKTNSSRMWILLWLAGQ